MQSKRYSVFISSTFNDLRDERRAVQDVVISAGDFPVQMESFPAADEDQMDFIKSLIDACDYYILIIGGRYGALADDGMSYTEKEYRYAVSIGVPVLALLHGDRQDIVASKSENSEIGRDKLDAFIKEVETNRLRKSWTTVDGLKLAVREALDHAKATRRRVGWVRGNALASVEALEELNEVRKENIKYREALEDVNIDLSLPPIPSASEAILIEVAPNRSWARAEFVAREAVTIEATWISAFPIYFSSLKWDTSDWDGEDHYYPNEEASCIEIGSMLAGEVAGIDTSKYFKINKNTFDRLTSYYIECGLMNTIGSDRPFTEVAERFARRHRIASTPEPRFSLVKGVIELVAAPGVDDFNDDIPF